MLDPSGRWYDNPTHPIWGLILVALIMSGAAWLSSANADNFDETEWNMLKEFAAWTVTVVFGGGAITRFLQRRSK
jgi:hypothetical protein